MHPQPDRILVIRTSALGDIVRAAPALASLRRAYPNAHIDWLITDTFAPAIQHHPALSNVIPFPRKHLESRLKSGHLFEVLRWARETLAAPRYDLVIDFQGLLRSGLLTRATRSPWRVGFADAREGARFAYTQRVSIEGGRSRAHVERNFDLLRAIGVEPVPDLRLYPGEEAHRQLDQDPSLAKARFVLLSPTTKGQGRAWPMERFAALARHLLHNRQRLGIDAVVVSGMENERGVCAPLLQAATANEGLIDRVGSTSIRTLMALIERAALVVCNDSAAMHMAVAFGRPLVALFGPTDVGHAGPYQRAADVISHKKPGEEVRHRDVRAATEFMKRVGVEEVVDKCSSILLAQTTHERIVRS